MCEKILKTHKDLDVWKKSMELAEKFYYLTKRFPHDERYGLVSQIRRSAVSIPSNIAEGAARGSKKEFIQFLYISLGSLSELETQSLLSERLKLLNDRSVFIELELIRKMLLGLIRSMKN